MTEEEGAAVRPMPENQEGEEVMAWPPAARSPPRARGHHRDGWIDREGEQRRDDDDDDSGGSGRDELVRKISS
uniref:DUF834 domain-containing protein n=1 Tax=Oryza punctata TaxID=4537 RepID=A0A0E0LIH3_ORYPU